MTTTHPEGTPTKTTQVSLSDALSSIEERMACMPDRLFDHEFYEGLAAELRRFHAQLRAHHAVATYHAGGEAIAQLSPEYADQISRLHSEHSTLLGMLDRLIRSAETMCDLPLEDKEVFAMRVREVMAVTRRHEAEEDRLFYLSLWRDIGGEC